MKIGVIGAVGTTELTVKVLSKHGFEIVGILGHEPKNRLKVSGIRDLAALANELGIDYRGYSKINDDANLAWMSTRSPELIFAVGFSQLLGKSWLNLAPKGCIGFHPTLLPEGRGRAPIAWLILEKRNGAATFFQMGEGADDGAIHVQSKFELLESDDAETLVPKLQEAIGRALDEWLPKLKGGEWNPNEQDHSKATYYGKREPSDGLIDWNNDAEDIDRLIKASCRPHPGAFTFCQGKLYKVWKSSVEKHSRHFGVIGRIVAVRDQSYLIQCKNSHLWIHEIAGELPVIFKEGDTFEGDKNRTLNEDLNKMVLNV